MVTISQHRGERSEKASDKEVLNSYARLLNCRVYRDEVVSAGGSTLLALLDGATQITGLESFDGHLVVWYLKDDSGTTKTHVSELVLNNGSLVEQIVEESGSSNQLKHALTRKPKIDVSPSAIFYTLGGNGHKLIETGGNIKQTTDLANLTNITSLCFGDNRIFAVSGRDMYCTDQVAGGDCSDFANDAYNSWLKGGRFPSSFSQECTNIEYNGGRVVGYSPNKIEVKTMTQTQETISSTIYITKKLEHYGEVGGLGTRSYRRLGRYRGDTYFLDEDAKIFYRFYPEKDVNGKLNPDPILDNEGNIGNMNFNDVSIFYSRKLKNLVLSGGERGQSLLFDPLKRNFSRVQWNISDMTEDSNGDTIYASDGLPKVFRHNPDTILQDGEIMSAEIETNDLIAEEFFRKLKIKRLAFMVQGHPESVIELYQSVDGGDWTSVDVDLEVQNRKGKFVSPYQIVGLTTVDMANRKTSDVVGIVKGKIRAKAKGTMVRYKWIIKSPKPFSFKYWGIPKSKVSSFMKNNTITPQNNE